MKVILTCLLMGAVSLWASGQSKTVHVFVALCDNEHQGIVPVPPRLGDGKIPNSNLYWGAAYGVKHFFDKKAPEWKQVKVWKPTAPIILERVLYKHITEDAYLLADAYDGEQIRHCIEDFLKASNGQSPIEVSHEDKTLLFGGGADLMAYVGHDGLMDFEVSVPYIGSEGERKEVMVPACYSKAYFSTEIEKAGALPLLWTTHLMAPEAYTLRSAIDGWLKGEAATGVVERAAQAYHQYQKCGIKGARNLFTTGF